MAMCRRVTHLCVVLSLLWTSCGNGGPGASYASSYSRKADWAPGIPATPASSDKVVRPDQMVVAFSFGKEAVARETLLPALKAAVEQYTRSATDTTKAELAVKLRGFVPGVASVDGKPGWRATVQGELIVTLPEALDYWGRSELMAALLQVGEQTLLAAEKTGLEVSISAPVVRLKDPEAYRAELMKRWVEQARAFASTAQGDRPLQLEACAPPGAVEQQVVTVEEVVLKLAMNCQLSAPPALPQ
ncbi:hypothetical protein [Hyalangium versicolor]|uniref:hypothetical protein n=1 Tax=Hyalangium versicolor TaxID=2861190 RepID=UPI001CCECBF1|nr:hypothetical protein [Hyalangium versicolor]